MGILRPSDIDGYLLMGQVKSRMGIVLKLDKPAENSVSETLAMDMLRL